VAMLKEAIRDACKANGMVFMRFLPQAPRPSRVGVTHGT
jgi:hypothetical protein